MKKLITLWLFTVMFSCNGPINRNQQSQIPAASQTATSDKDESDGQISQVVRMMFQDSQGTIWFGTQNGAFKLTDDTLVSVEGIKDEAGKGVTVKDIAEDSEGKIWVAYEGGISSIDGQVVTNYHEVDGLANSSVWSIETDDKGNVWIGTLEGVYLFNGQEFEYFETPEGKIDPTLGISSEKMIHDILKDSKGTIWLCTNAGLFSYDGDTLLDVSKKVGISTNFVNNIYESSSGALWVSTKKGLYKLIGDHAVNITEGEIENRKGIGSVVEDKDGVIWFVANQHHLYAYRKNSIIEFQKSADNKGPVVFQIYKDQDGRLWFVGFGGAFRMENGQFLNVTKGGPW
ncbi:MAG: two-component regulator propeller domain-containing protein [Bacteroidota bacterium]